MAKQIKYGVAARKALEAGVNQLADTVRDPWTEGTQRCPG